MKKIKDNFKKLPKAAKVKTVAEKIAWQDFLAKENFSEEIKSDAKNLVKLFEKTTKWKCVIWGKMFGFGNWEYISPKTGRNGLWPATAFAVRTNGFVVYTMLGHGGYQSLLKKLGNFKDAGKSCLSFKKLADVDEGILEKLIQTSLKDLKKKYVVK